MNARLYYIADPMCSWCWGFSSVIDAIEPRLRPDIELQLILGGLAPDSDQPMDEATKRYVQNAWHAVEARTQAQFNHEFWDRAQPRRSTWPACRAVLAAAKKSREMFRAIQRAYYLEARDPSDPKVLHTLAAELGFDATLFAQEMEAESTHSTLREHFSLRDELGVRGYPSLVFEREGNYTPLTYGYSELEDINARLHPLKVLL